MTTSRRVAVLRAARDEMNAVRDRIYAVAGPRSDAELLKPPPGGGWCAAEVLDHLRTGESKLVRALLKIEKGEPLRMPKRAYFYRLPMSIAFTNVKLRAPKLVRPRAAAELGPPHELLDAMKTSRKELRAYADRLGEERWLKLVFPHFLLGRFDGLDWYRFLAKHEGRHLAQMERILASLS
jgi:hypothetical protein